MARILPTEAEVYEELRRQNSEARKDAFALFGVAHYNYNGILRFRQSIERRVLEEQEKTMAEIKEIITKLNEIGDNSIKLAEFARVIVEENPKLADTLQFILSVELQEMTRSKNAD